MAPPKADITYDYIVERSDNYEQMQKILDRNGAMGYRLHTVLRVGTKCHQLIMEREYHRA